MFRKDTYPSQNKRSSKSKQVKGRTERVKKRKSQKISNKSPFKKGEEVKNDIIFKRN